MEKVTRPRMLTRSSRIVKRTDTILVLARGRLLTFLTKVKMRGVGILEPHHLSEEKNDIMNESTTELTNEDFREILRSIREIVVLSFGVAFALSPDEKNWEYILVIDDSLDVETLAESVYSNFRWDSMNASVGAGEVLLHEKESTGELILHEKEPPGVVIQHGEGSSSSPHLKGQRSNTVKRVKQ